MTSTEKLLELIRDKNKPQESNGPVSLSEARIKKKYSSIIRWPAKKKVSVGIDLGHNDIRMVKVKKSVNQQWKLLKYKSYTLDPHTPREDPKFSGYLRDALIDFCHTPRKVELWAIFSSSQIETRRIVIPKVPKKQIANAVYWTLKKESPFDERERIYDFQLLGDVTKGAIKKTAVMVYTASKRKVFELRRLFSKSGFPLSGISIAPFALQNLFKSGLIETKGETVASLYVGRTWSRINIFESDNLILTRGIKAGMNSLTEGIVDALSRLQKKRGEKPGKASADKDRESSRTAEPIDFEQARKLLQRLIPDAPKSPKDEAGMDLSNKKIFNMVMPPLNRLIRQAELSFEYHAQNLGKTPVKKVFIGGQINAYEPLVRYISDQLGLPSGTIDPLSPGSPFLGKMTAPNLAVERMAYAPAVGIALSDNTRTPNFIFTHKDREKKASTTRINHVLAAACVFISVVCLGISLWYGEVVKRKKATVVALQRELDQYRPRVNQTSLLVLASRAKQGNQQFKAYSKKYLGMAIIAALSKTTPPNIRLLGLTADMGNIGDKAHQARKKSVSLKGLIFGNEKKLETYLATYLLSLERLPLFGKPSILKINIEDQAGEPVLLFDVQMEIV